MSITRKTRRLVKITLLLYVLLLVWIIALKCNLKDAILGAKEYNQLFTVGERFEIYLSYFAKTDPKDVDFSTRKAAAICSSRPVRPEG